MLKKNDFIERKIVVIKKKWQEKVKEEIATLEEYERLFLELIKDISYGRNL
jgi:hypothetical protein